MNGVFGLPAVLMWVGVIQLLGGFGVVFGVIVAVLSVSSVGVVVGVNWCLMGVVGWFAVVSWVGVASCGMRWCGVFYCVCGRFVGCFGLIVCGWGVGGWVSCGLVGLIVGFD